MTFLIGDPCIGITDRSCMEVCPVHCIYEVGVDPSDPDLPYMLVIDPVECIDCGACEPECPVEAISIDNLLPAKWSGFEKLSDMHVDRGSMDAVRDDPRREEKMDIAEKAMELHEALARSEA